MILYNLQFKILATVTTLHQIHQSLAHNPAFTSLIPGCRYHPVKNARRHEYNPQEQNDVRIQLWLSRNGVILVWKAVLHVSSGGV